MELGNDENYADVIAELKEKLAEIDDELGVEQKCERKMNK